MTEQMTNTFVLTIGDESSGSVLLPIVDGVTCTLVQIAPNKYNPTSVLDFSFKINDPDYDEGDDEDNTTIQELSRNGYTYFERANLPQGEDIGKRTKLYRLIKGMRGGKEIETGEQVDLGKLVGKDYKIDFEHVDKKGGPPDFATVIENGRAVQKSAIAKIRPVKASRPKPPPAVVEDDDSDLYEDD